MAGGGHFQNEYAVGAVLELLPSLRLLQALLPTGSTTVGIPSGTPGDFHCILS